MVLDAHSLFQQIKDQTYTITFDGVTYTFTTNFTEVDEGYGKVGIFSKDGIHPSPVGHALIAYEVAKKIREKAKTQLEFGGMHWWNIKLEDFKEKLIQKVKEMKEWP